MSVTIKLLLVIVPRSNTLFYFSITVLHFSGEQNYHKFIRERATWGAC